MVTGNGEVDTLLQSVTTEESNRVFDQKLRPPWRNPLGQVVVVVVDTLFRTLHFLL